MFSLSEYLEIFLKVYFCVLLGPNCLTEDVNPDERAIRTEDEKAQPERNKL